MLEATASCESLESSGYKDSLTEIPPFFLFISRLIFSLFSLSDTHSHGGPKTMTRKKKKRKKRRKKKAL